MNLRRMQRMQHIQRTHHLPYLHAVTTRALRTQDAFNQALAAIRTYKRIRQIPYWRCGIALIQVLRPHLNWTYSVRQQHALLHLSDLSWTVGLVRQDRQDRTGPSLSQTTLIKRWFEVFIFHSQARTRKLNLAFACADPIPRHSIRMQLPRSLEMRVIGNLFKWGILLTISNEFYWQSFHMRVPWVII